MDGDEVRKKGTVAGGYRDPNRSKMQLAKGYKVVSPLFLAFVMKVAVSSASQTTAL